MRSAPESPTPESLRRMTTNCDSVIVRSALSWTANIIALAIAGLFVVNADTAPDSGVFIAIGLGVAGVVWA
ncbi:MAG TPA: hypothetical protein VEN78_34665, partial [Bradyrhizobium sp.]|nr:hypothetical protein [Bradyrhizobium sp.]